MSAGDNGAKKTKIVSCAECRRLKLKCDKKFPCSSCCRRDLAALCPDGALPTRPRMLLAEAEVLKVKVLDMTERIHELEDALRFLNAEHSNQPHPLLKKHGYHHEPLSRRLTTETESESQDGEDLDDLDESLGTLTIDAESGKSSFFGQSAGMESLYHNDLREESPSLSSLRPAWTAGPFDPIMDSVLNPLYPKASQATIMMQLEEHLPDPGRAWALCDLYFNNAAWLYSPISRSQFEEEILLTVYTPALPSLANTPYVDASTMFMVFAIGSLLDPNNPAGAGESTSYSHPGASGSLPSVIEESIRPDHAMGPEAEQYHQLARAALSAGNSIIEEPTVAAVRTIFLMAYYHLLLDRKQSPQNVWLLISIAVGLANSIGLHRDSGRWKLEDRIVEQRRAVFWELYFFLSLQLKVVQAMTFGRPPPLTLPFIDCEIGTDLEQKLGPDGQVIHGYQYQKRVISSKIMPEIRDLVLATKQPKYSDVLVLDRKLRDCSVEVFGGPLGGHDIGPSPTRVETMQQLYILALKEVLALCLHRKYFVRACTSASGDLLKSRYCPSLLAAFRSAQLIIVLMGRLLDVESELPRRFWFFWNQMLAGAIIVGSIAIRHPQSVLAAEAMYSLKCVLEQFRQSANRGDRADRPTKALKIVTQLHERAQHAMSQPEANEEATGPAIQPQAQDTDELSVLAGHARVFSTKHSEPATYTSSSLDDYMAVAADVHPSLMEDLNVMNQEDQNPFRGTSVGPDEASLREWYTEPNMFRDTGEHVPGVSQPEYFNPGDTGAAGMDVFSDMFAVGPGGSPARDDPSWQNFMAGLGLGEEYMYQ